MTKKQSIQIFEEKKVRTVWNEEEEKWYFSVLDVVEVLTDSVNPTDYFKKMRKREPELAEYVGTNCPHVEMITPTGKKRKTIVGDTETIFRIIQSIPSPKAEPFKQWMAQVASLRIDQMQDPELSIEQAVMDYKRLGYSDNWINQRIKSIEVRKALTDEWKRCGMEEGMQFATLTDIITKTWSGKTTKEYKQYKGLKKENLRDNLSKEHNPETFDENINIAHKGGKVARSARLELEKQLGHSVVTPLNAKQYLNQIDNPKPNADDKDN